MKITEEILKRHAQGLCTEEEKRAVEEWFKKDVIPESELGEVKDKDPKKARVWSQLRQAVPQLENQSGSIGPVIPLYKRVMRYAAVAIILLTVGYFAYQSLSGSLFGTGGTTQVIALQTIETKRGEKRTVTLSDGSTIRMNYETQIKAPEKFKGDQRIVYLTGHAHFDVARDTERPFIIYTKDSKTQVMGTSFDINTKGEEETEIIVKSGKVAFSKKDQKDNQVVMLTVNDRAVLNPDKNIETNQVDAQKLTAWKDNRLVFEDKSLNEIIEVLEPWYDVRISVENQKLLNESFNLSLDNPPLKGVLDRLAFMAGFDYKIDGKKVIII